MKRFLTTNKFENYFDSNLLYRGQGYYNEDRILDIWYQENDVTAYIDGSEIYKVKLEIENEKIIDYFCSCPYSENGEYTCKHMAAVLYYLRDNDVAELEKIKEEKSNQTKSELEKIYDRMQREVKNISDRNGFINFYNGKYFLNLISNITDDIEDFIDNEEYDNAFELIKYTYHFITDTDMDGSNGEYQDSLHELSLAASDLLEEENYFQEFLKWAKDIEENNELGDFSDAPLYTFILYAHDKESASRVIEILDDCDFLYGIFIDKILDKISLVHDFIDKDEAIKLCYQSIDTYGVREKLIKYLKEENRTDELIKVLKDNLKNATRKDIVYNELLKIYAENNMYEEKIKLLPEIIIETNNFDKYIELKYMCSDSEWEQLKKEIIPKINPDNTWILEEIYQEENEIDKLFSLIKKEPDIRKLYKYQDTLKDKYSKELLDFYKPQIIEKVKYASTRERYQVICKYIKKMSELTNSKEFIFEMLEEMYPLYRSKKAFKEEIMNVLTGENKIKFANLIVRK